MSFMEELWNDIFLRQGKFRLGTDSVLLADFISLPKHAVVADLGSGSGALGLLLCAREPTCRVCGIEIDEESHRIAEQNVEENALRERLTPIWGDVRQIRSLLPAGSADCVISNPPYFPPDSGKVANARRSELTLNLSQLCAAAAWLLPSGGRFALVHRPERLCDIFCTLRENGLEPKRIRFVRHKQTSPICLVLIEARRGGKAGLSFEPDLIEFHEDGTETEDYRAAYHRGEHL